MSIDPSQIRVLGPLSPFAAGFAEELAQQGYRSRAVCNQMYLVAHLSRWLLGEGIGAEKLHAAEVGRLWVLAVPLVTSASSRSKRCSPCSFTCAILP